MEYLNLSNKKEVFLSHSDCVDMTILGYECFDFLFTHDDWFKITDQPLEGLHFFHTPSALSIIKMAINKKITLHKRYYNLVPMIRKYENRMLSSGLLFPNEWENGIIDRCV